MLLSLCMLFANVFGLVTAHSSFSPVSVSLFELVSILYIDDLLSKFKYIYLCSEHDDHHRVDIDSVSAIAAGCLHRGSVLQMLFRNFRGRAQTEAHKAHDYF